MGIEHDAVDCIVAGKFPRMNACFQPASALATARVYFRVEGTEDWYYVEMGPEAPCYSGYLPKPGKQLVDKKIEYYVQATGKQYAEGQTQIYDPIVVSSEDRCQKKLAPYVSRASVRVFPAMPGGFAASSFPVALVAGAGAATAAGVGTAVALSGGDNSTTTTQGSAPTTVAVVPTTAPPTTGTAPPPPPPTTNSAPTARLRTNPDPIQGDSPLHVTFNLCSSTDPDGDDLTFRFSFGDGAFQEGDSCLAEHTYNATAATTVRTHDAVTSESCVKDPSHAYQCISRSATYNRVTDRCLGTSAPSIELTSPGEEDSFYGYDVINFRSAVTPGTWPTTGSPLVIQKVRYFAESMPLVGKPGAQPASIHLGDGTAPTDYPFDLSNPCSAIDTGPYSYAELVLSGRALDECGNEGASNNVHVYLYCGGYYGKTSPPPTARSLAWTNQLDVPGARTQVVLNGRSASYPGTGRSMGLGEGRRGENRIEAHLIEATGPGLWSFQFVAGSLEPGSLQAVAGQVAEVSNDSITFRLSGEPGEQVVFTFRPKR